MIIEQVVVLIPSHSLEDLPTDLNEEQAAQLMNAFVLAWDPFCLLLAENLPREVCAEISPEAGEQSIYLVPEVSRDELPGNWQQRAIERGAILSYSQESRSEWLTSLTSLVVQKYPAALSITDALAQPLLQEIRSDFHALGFCYLQLELLTRRMRHYPEWDRNYVKEQAVIAAKALSENDLILAKSSIKRCFEIFMESRERFFPVDCYLLDLCLFVPEYAGSAFKNLLQSSHHSTLLATTKSLTSLQTQDPETFSLLRTRLKDQSLYLAGGEWKEGVNPLFPFNSQIHQIQKGVNDLHNSLELRTEYFASRAFNLSAHLTDHLERAGFRGAMHLALEEGTYPVEGQSKIDWQGASDLVKPAIAKIPFPADSATSFLQYPEKMADAMDHEHVACLSYIHWPQLNSPWLGDLLRIASYYPVLGKFVTLHEFLSDTPSRGHLSILDQKLYRSATLSALVAKKQSNPVSRWLNIVTARRTFDAANSTRMISIMLNRLVKQQQLDDDADFLNQFSSNEDKFEASLIENPTFFSAQQGVTLEEGGENRINSHHQFAGQRLSRLVCSQSRTSAKGLFFFNSLGVKRSSPVCINSLESPPPMGELPWQKTDQGFLNIIDLPAYGYYYHDLNSPASSTNKQIKSDLMVEENVLRTDGFQVMINPETGGISQVKNYGRHPNRLSQQLSYRFANVKLLHGTSETTNYSQMICDQLETTANGPVMGEITSSGRLVDPEVGDTLANFTQHTRVYRKCPFVEVTIKLDTTELPRDNPWKNYYALRFAWNNPLARVRSSIQQRLDDIGDDRLESTDAIEINDDNIRTSIIMPGLPFHVKTHARMLDTIIIPAGEMSREFTFRIALDQLNPIAESYNLSVPVFTETLTGSLPPANQIQGWFFYPGSKNLLINRIYPALLNPDQKYASGDSLHSVNIELLEALGVDVNAQFCSFIPFKSAAYTNLLQHIQKKLESSTSPNLRLKVPAYRSLQLTLEF